MKITDAYSQLPFLWYLVLISLTLAILLLPAPAHSEFTGTTQTRVLPDATTNSYKASKIEQNTLQAQGIPDRKKVLLDDSRGLSAFFILGIVINIIMAASFAWWFSKEWRKSRK